MIKDTDGDSFKDMRSLEQDLTFDTAKQEFQGRRLAFDQPQMKTLGLLNADGIYTNLGLLLSEQCTHTVKAAVFEGRDQSVFRDRQEFSGSLLGLSICRNPKLANVFYRLQLIEAYGTGMNKIIRAYDHSGKRPLIETTDNAFKITLPNLHEGAEKVKESPKKDLEYKVLRFAAASGSISRKETQEVTGLGTTATGRLLKGIVEESILV